jgi:hypothetical protein
MIRNRRQMQKSAEHLSPVISHPDGLQLYFLTGSDYLYQTLFCIQSLSKHSQEKFRFTLVDDGSFNEKLIQRMRKQVPGVEVITHAMIEQNIARCLPPRHYPVLSRKRREYPHIKKLTDIHTLPGKDWKLVLDSDMLFWAEPAAIIQWLKDPQEPIHMVDCIESYGYSRDLLEELAGTTPPRLLNVGVIGLNSLSLDWEKLENWVNILEEKEGKSYYLEQALSALSVAHSNCSVLNPAQYIVNPGSDQFKNHSCLQHYVDLSKKWYYDTGWRKIFHD